MITDRNQVEQTIIAQREFLSKIINALPVGVFAKAVQDDYRFTIWNNKMEQLFDTPREKILGKSDYDLFPETEANYFRETDITVIKGGEIVDIPVEEVTTSQGVRQAHTIKVPIYNRSGEPETLLAILEDITERRKAEETLAKRPLELEKALSEMEALYAGSARVIHSLTVDQILEALIDSTALQRFDRANILFFDRVWDDRQPEFLTVAAVWERSGHEAQSSVALHTQYPLTQFPTLESLSRHEYTIYQDIMSDKRLDDNARTLLDRMGMRGMVVFPLVTSGQWIGLITAQATSPLTIKEEEIRQIGSLIDQAAAIIQNQRLFDQMQAALAETETLYDMSAELNAATTLDEILQATILPSITTGANYANLFIIEVDEHNQPQWLELKATWGHQGRTPVALGTRLHLSAYPGGHLWVEQPDELLMMEDIFNDERVDAETRARYQSMGAQATITLPLNVGSEWVGLITINWPTPQKFTERDVRLYKSLTAQTAILVNNKILLGQAQQRAEREQVVNRITQKIQRTTSVENALKTTIQELGQALQPRYTQVQLKTDEVKSRK
jgi:PAS domain S-box-containing protein